MSAHSPLIRSLEYGAFLVFSPKGQTKISQDSKTVCYALKNDRAFSSSGRTASRDIAQMLKDHFARLPFAEWFDGSALLVPVPRNTPLVPNALWPANALCRAIVEIGLARETMPLLSRTKPVKKSATAERGHRPRPDEHYETLRATASLNPVRRAVLVDDVVTKGSTLVAAASRLREVLPNSEIVGFSAVRTMGLIPEVDRIIQPVRSTITFNGFDAARHD